MKSKQVLSICFTAIIMMAGWTPVTAALLGDQTLIRPGIEDAVIQNFIVLAPSELMVSNFPGVLPVCLEWEDNSNNETGFTLERSINNGPFYPMTTVDSNIDTYTDYDVSNDQYCRYRVFAYSSSGKSAYSNEVEWITTPNQPGDLTGNLDKTDFRVNLYWEGNNTYANYKLQKKTIKSGKTIIEQINLPAKASSYIDTEVEAGFSYTYLVTASGSNGSSSPSNSITIDYLSAPSDVMVSNFPGTPKLSVSWKDTSDNENKFIVEKAHSNQGPIYRYDAGMNSTEFVDNVEADLLYMYRVYAVNDHGFSPYSEVAYWYSPPGAPENFKAEAVSTSEIKLSWDDRSAYENLFKITRKSDNTFVFIDVPANTTTYLDQGLKGNTTYAYSIRAFNSESQTWSKSIPDASAATKAVDISNIIINSNISKNLPKFNTVLEIGSPVMKINGEVREIDPGKGTVPVIVEGRTLLPIRAIIEAYGGSVAWDDSARKVTISCSGKIIELWIDSLNTRVNGEDKTSNVAPQIINERTMLPVRFISENIGLDVQWNPNTNQVSISAES